MPRSAWNVASYRFRSVWRRKNLDKVAKSIRKRVVGTCFRSPASFSPTNAMKSAQDKKASVLILLSTNILILVYGCGWFSDFEQIKLFTNQFAN